MKRVLMYRWLFFLSALVLIPILSRGDLAGLFTGPVGTLRLLITDKPFPFEFVTSALVTITEIRVRQASTQPTTQNDDAEDDTSDDTSADDSGQTEDERDDDSFLTIFEGERFFDLLDLRKGRADLLAVAQIPVGTWNQMRLVVTGGIDRKTWLDSRPVQDATAARFRRRSG